MFISPAIRAAFATLSVQELQERLATLEAQAAKLKAQPDTGDVATIAMARGQWRNVTRKEHGLNILRQAWMQTNAILQERAAL